MNDLIFDAQKIQKNSKLPPPRPPQKKQQPGGPSIFCPKRREVMGLVGVCFLLKGKFFFPIIFRRCLELGQRRAIFRCTGT